MLCDGLLSQVAPSGKGQPMGQAEKPEVITEPAAAAAALERALLAARRTVVLTGAGLSTESGIPDYRSPGGIWSQMQPIEFSAFCTSEAARRTDWERRIDMAARFRDAEPNAAHRALAHYCMAGKVTALVTQNIDGLHLRAGTPHDALIEIHGTGAHAHCLDCGAQSSIADAERTITATGLSPRCERCGGLVKAAVISFGEPMPEELMRRAVEASDDCDLFFAAGTSLVVYPAAGLLQIAHQRNAKIIIASMAPTAMDSLADVAIRAPLATTFASIERLEFG